MDCYYLMGRAALTLSLLAAGCFPIAYFVEPQDGQVYLVHRTKERTFSVHESAYDIQVGPNCSIAGGIVVYTDERIQDASGQSCPVTMTYPRSEW